MKNLFLTADRASIDCCKYLKWSSVTLLLCFSFLSQQVFSATCEYIVANHWGSGFIANIRITNSGSTPINGWEVSWQYSDGSTRTSGWNANVSGSNPYTATPFSWNANISPGKSVEFGVQGIKGVANGVPEIPTVTGAVCGSVNPTPTPVPTPTSTPTPAPTLAPTATATPTATPVPTATPAPTATPTSTPSSSSSSSSSSGGITCAVTNLNNWGSGYQMDVSVTNNGSAVSGWEVQLSFEQAPQVSNGWNAVLTTSGNVVTAKNVSWNSNLGAGQTTSFGLQGNSSGAFNEPTCAAPGSSSSSSSSSSTSSTSTSTSSTSTSTSSTSTSTSSTSTSTSSTSTSTSSSSSSTTSSSGALTGEQLFSNMCSGCHGADAAGGRTGVALNTPRDLVVMKAYIASNMPRNNPTACDADCAELIGDWISETLWGVTPPLACDDVNYGARQLKILTRSEYQHSVEDLFGVDFNVSEGLSADANVSYFVNNTQAAIVSSSYDQYLTVAEQIATWSAGRDFVPALNCNGSFNQACATQFVTELAPKVIRRPLDSAETTRYSEMVNGTLTGGDVKAGIQLGIEALLSSPEFIYRHEIGELNPSNSLISSDAYELTSYEMATWLSYTFTGTTPDATALQKAANNLLRTDAEILAEAQRLLNSTKAKETLGDFVGNWLDTDHLENSPKDATAWPGFANLIPHLKQEIREVFAHVMLDPQEKFESLYDADYTFVNGPLAAHYGIDGVTGDAFQQVATTDRGGVLVNGAFMSRWAEDVETSPIRRSVRVRRRMLCQNQPAPPANIALGRQQALEENAAILKDPATTNRLKYHTITNTEPCVTCHQAWINPMGFGMEDFNPVGNPRTVDLRGNPIDASGQLYAPENLIDKDISISFQGSKGLGALLTTLPSAQTCVPQNLFRYVMGVGTEGIDVSNPEGPTLDPTEQNGYVCEVQNLTNTMMTQSPRAMLESMGIMQAVRYRKAWAR